MTGLTLDQHNQLLAPINKRRVGKKDGQSHVEAYDVRAHLNRIFGFGRWSEDVIDVTMLYEQSKQDGDNVRWRAAYRATVRLTVCDPTGTVLATYTEAATGSNFGWLPDTKRDETHDMAIKTAASQALKRCAINLGDQFGLSLYNKGSLAALVGRSLVVPSAAPDSDPRIQTAAPDAHITEQLAPEDTLVPEAEPPAATPPGQGDTAGDPVEDARAAALAVTKKGEASRLLMQVIRDGIGGAMTTDADGKGVLLQDLVKQRIKDAA